MKTIVEQSEEYAKRNKSDTKKAWIDGYNAALKKKSARQELDLSFVPDNFMLIVQTWIDYKQERKQPYTQRGIEACVYKLQEMSNGNPQIAAKIIGQSMANNWAGLFELKDGNRNSQTAREIGNHTSIFEVADQILQRDKQ